MTITMLIEELQAIQKTYPDAQVKLHHKESTSVMFALAAQDGTAVGLEDRKDIKTPNELQAQYEIAAETMMDELEFFSNMVARGFTLNDFKSALNKETFEYAKNFMEEHGLI